MIGREPGTGLTGREGLEKVLVHSLMFRLLSLLRAMRRVLPPFSCEILGSVSCRFLDGPSLGSPSLSMHRDRTLLSTSLSHM